MPLIVQTLVLPDTELPITCKLGYLAPEFHWMSWCLSFGLLKNLYSEIHLYTNNKGKDILIDRLKLPYSKVFIIPEHIAFADNLWAAYKIYTYSKQARPFIHVDGDVFIGSRFRDINLDDDLLVQNFEYADDLYSSVYRDLIANCFVLPVEIENELTLKKPKVSINAGVIGGSDTTFFKSYSSKAFDFLNVNNKQLQLLTDDRINLIFEQHLFYCLAKETKNIKPHLTFIMSDMGYPGFASFPVKTVANSYLHLVGNFKDQINVCILLSKQLKSNFPTYYKRVLNCLSEDNVELYFNSYRKNRHTELPNSYYYLDEIPIDWQSYYDLEQQQFEFIEFIFSDEKDISKALFFMNDLIIAHRTEVNKGSVYYLSPFAYMRAYREVECDLLDQVIFHLLKKPMSFCDLLSQLKSKFDEEEVNNDFQKYFNLILLRVKSACLSNVILISMIDQTGIT